MKVIKQFNYTINNSYNIDERHEYWSAYRKEVTEFVTTIDFKNKDILLVGAGNLNDIDVCKIAEDLKSMTLLDVDSSAVASGLNRQSLKPNEFTVIEQELTSLDDTDFFDDYKKALSSDGLDGFFSGFANYELGYDLEKFDVVIVLPVYTQILFHQLMTIANNFLAGVDHETAEKIMTFSSTFISKINNKLLASLNPKGVMVCLSDVLEYTNDSEEYNVLKRIINNRTKTVDFYNDYLMTYGYTLGAYGLYDLESKGKVDHEQFFIWEFDEKRKMLVKGIINNMD